MTTVFSGFSEELLLFHSKSHVSQGYVVVAMVTLVQLIHTAANSCVSSCVEEL